MDKETARKLIEELAAADFDTTKNVVPNQKHFESAHDTIKGWVDLDNNIRRAVKVLGLNLAACIYAATYDLAVTMWAAEVVV